MMLKILLVALAALVASTYAQDPQFESPIVCAKHAGCIRGTRLPGYHVDHFEAFIGVPYALPPVGELRFSSPQPFPKSSNTINATEPRPECLQKNPLTSEISGAEDCLFLNIYRPVLEANNNKPLPVMVYIHEGGFAIGTNNPKILGPQYFMDTQEVIFVSIAYRLGVFGFLSANDSNIPGNYGMKDQRLALKWIQQNIDDFGGDAKQVTIMGLSAGGISVHLHMLSNNSAGLFQRAISLSGSATSPITFQRDPVQVARQTAVNCHITDARTLPTSELLRELRSVPFEVLVRADDHLRYWDKDPAALYVLAIENSNTDDTFLNRYPSDILQSGDYKGVPYLAGVVPNEGAVRAAGIWENVTLRNSFNENFDYLLEALLVLPPQFDRARLNSIMEKVINEYFGGKHELTKQGLVDALTDFWFHYPLYHDSKLFLHKNAAPLYLYRFNYTGPQSIIPFYAGGLPNFKYGVVHGDDIFYIFNMSIPDFPKTSQDADAIHGYVEFFIDFALNRKSFTGKECDAHNFATKSADIICDFVTFENGPNGEFCIGSDNKFLNNRARLLEQLLTAN